MRQNLQLNVPKKRCKNRRKEQKRYYSGKKKRHTLKAQVVVDKATSRILCTDFSIGKRHDFKWYELSGVKVKQDTQIKADSGYSGIQKTHINSQIPHKSSKLKKLTKSQKRENKALSSERVLNEHVIGRIKRFRIIKDTYRNRRKRFGLRFNLIAAICNFEIQHQL